MVNKQKVQTMIYATRIRVQCPNCNKWVDDFFSGVDIRGDEVECDHCKETFSVHRDADIEI